MNRSPRELISGYFDDVLSDEEHQELSDWLIASRANAEQFAHAALLHDRIRGELLATAEIANTADAASVSPARSVTPLSVWRRATLWATTLLVVAGSVLCWNGVGDRQVAAASIELDRLISVTQDSPDRIYQIAVESVALPLPRREPREPDGRRRPPKPPMDGAMLFVRRGGQFVLERTTDLGLLFVTGSDGQVSWAVRPDGPVRFSTDVTRFNHDVPGHEFEMPLVHLEEGLERLKFGYEVTLMPIESPVDEQSADAVSTRLLVAVKQRGGRGPQRVEVTYDVESGLIQQLRFVDMPYGPERLTLRLTLFKQRYLGTEFFKHDSHHSPDRVVEFEE